MILSDSRILEEIEKGTIKIEPYNRDCLGSTIYRDWETDRKSTRLNSSH